MVYKYPISVLFMLGYNIHKKGRGDMYFLYIL